MLFLFYEVEAILNILSHEGPARENLVRLNESKTRIDYKPF